MSNHQYIRDHNSKALINTDKETYIAAKRQRDFLRVKEKATEARLQAIENSIAEILSILKELTK